MTWFIYLIIHKRSGRVYVGQTTRPLETRWHYHATPSSGCLRLRNAIQKYGPEEFDMFRIDQASSQDEVDVLEEQYIASHRSQETDWGFNITKGGRGFRKRFCKRGHDMDAPGGRMPSDDTCRQCSQERDRLLYTPEFGKAKRERRKELLLLDPERSARLLANNAAKQRKKFADPVARDAKNKRQRELHAVRMQNPEYREAWRVHSAAWRAKQKAAA